MKKIRVGLVRCDMHGMYYGALMADHAPLRLQKPMDNSAGAPYTWMSGGAHFYFYTFYSDPTRMTVPCLHEFEIARVWDEHPGVGDVFARVFTARPHVCEHVHEVSDDVDLVLVADCNYDGADHLELARPGLEKGVPTFIDKPLANNLENANAIVGLARKHSAPLLSRSILNTLPQARQFAARFPEVGNLEFVSIRGGGPSLAGQIHAICLAQNFFGSGVRAVESMGENTGGFMRLVYPDEPRFPRCGAMLSCDTGDTYHCAFYASAYGNMGDIHSPPLGDYVFPYGAYENIKLIRKMVDTRQPPVPYPEILESVAVATAAVKAHNTGRQISLQDVGYAP